MSPNMRYAGEMGQCDHLVNILRQKVVRCTVLLGKKICEIHLKTHTNRPVEWIPDAKNEGWKKPCPQKNSGNWNRRGIANTPPPQRWGGGGHFLLFFASHFLVSMTKFQKPVSHSPPPGGVTENFLKKIRLLRLRKTSLPMPCHGVFTVDFCSTLFLFDTVPIFFLFSFFNFGCLSMPFS